MKIKPILITDKKMIIKCIELGKIHYFENIVLLGDLFYPCAKLTDIYGLYDNSSNLVCCFTIFKGFKNPSVVIPHSLTFDQTDHILKTLSQFISDKFTLVSFTLQKKILEKYFRVTEQSNEFCMITDNSKFNRLEIDPTICKHVEKKDFDKIDSFYQVNNAYPWNPIQLESNLYFLVEKNQEIIACGGTHFETSKSAHLGNILVVSNYRGKYYGTKLVNTIVNAILKVKTFATLFVTQENVIAISMYEKLGFSIYKPVAIFTCYLD